MSVFILSFILHAPQIVKFLCKIIDMTNDAIIKQVEAKSNFDKPLNIHFRKRDTIRGLFIKSEDYNDLKSKNLWRIVANANIERWEKARDMNLARIFNGVEFTKLSEVV